MGEWRGGQVHKLMVGLMNGLVDGSVDGWMN